MTHHFADYLNVKALIDQHNPSWILELGAGSGHNTRNLLDTGRRVAVITDGRLPDGWESEVVLGNMQWICGISYLEIPKLQQKVEFCVLDTDHNGWTLRREMEELEKVMAPGGIVCIHDTETFGNTNGVMQEYVCRVPYPAKEIEQCALLYGEAWKRDGWTLIRESKESNGAVALQWKQ